MTSRLKIAEYKAGNYAGIQAPIADGTQTEQAFIDFTDGAPHQSAAFGGDTRLIEVSTNASCAILVGGKNPTASENSQFMPAGGLRVYVVQPADKLSVIADS